MKTVDPAQLDKLSVLHREGKIAGLFMHELTNMLVEEIDQIIHVGEENPAGIHQPIFDTTRKQLYALIEQKEISLSEDDIQFISQNQAESILWLFMQKRYSCKMITHTQISRLRQFLLCGMLKELKKVNLKLLSYEEAQKFIHDGENEIKNKKTK